jgi:quinol monooxygenase YgiN
MRFLTAMLATMLALANLPAAAAETERYGLHGKFTATPGNRDALAGYLLEAAQKMASAPGCQLYYVSLSPTEPEAVWVSEVWDSKPAHDASLSLPGTRELIAKARPLIAAMEGTVTTPLGGKGVR